MATIPGPTPSAADNDAVVEVVVEIPRGSRNKYEEADDGVIWFDRRLGGPAGFPGDYGYVVGAQGEDGDALDALVLLEEATFPGVRIRCRVLGSFVLHMSDDTSESKLVCVPRAGQHHDHLGVLEDLPEQFLKELDAFFEAYRMLENHRVERVEHRGLSDSLNTLARARRAARTTAD